MLTMYSTQKGLQDQQNEAQRNSNAMGKAFDASKNDDSFYLPPETFNNAEFKKGMKNFISPDGHAVRFIISHDGDPMSQEGISHIAAIKKAGYESLKDAKVNGAFGLTMHGLFIATAIDRPKRANAWTALGGLPNKGRTPLILTAASEGPSTNASAGAAVGTIKVSRPLIEDIVRFAFSMR